MKKIIVIAALVGLGWFVWTRMQNYASQERIQNSAPVKYVTNMEEDVRKAQKAADTANQKIQQDQQQLNQGLQDSSK